jgi:hypothetical protein
LREARDGRAAEQRPAAQEELSAVEARVARLRIEIRGLASTDQVTLDARPISPAALGAELPVDPGERVVAVTRDARQVLREAVMLAEGERRDVSLTVRAPPPRIGVGDHRGDGRRDRDRDRDRGDEGPSVFASPWFWVVVGVLAAGTTAALLIVFAGPTEPAYAGNVPPGYILLH